MNLCLESKLMEVLPNLISLLRYTCEWGTSGAPSPPPAPETSEEDKTSGLKSGSLAHASRMKQRKQALSYSQELGWTVYSIMRCEWWLNNEARPLWTDHPLWKRPPKCWGSVTQCQESDLWSCATFRDPRGVGVNQIAPPCNAGRGRPWCPAKVVPSSWRQELPAVDTH